MIDTLKALLKPRFIFTFMFYGAFINLVLSETEIPELLKNTVNLLLGFWFGERSKKGIPTENK